MTYIKKNPTRENMAEAQFDAEDDDKEHKVHVSVKHSDSDSFTDEYKAAETNDEPKTKAPRLNTAATTSPSVFFI